MEEEEEEARSVTRLPYSGHCLHPYQADPKKLSWQRFIMMVTNECSDRLCVYLRGREWNCNGLKYDSLVTLDASKGGGREDGRGYGQVRERWGQVRWGKGTRDQHLIYDSSEEWEEEWRRSNRQIKCEREKREGEVKWGKGKEQETNASY